MSGAHPHSKLITAAARDVLRPIGLVQKGRSRSWLDDQGWWLGVVEFQSSSFSRGSYLNVGVNWLWNPKTYLSFDYGHRVHLGQDQFYEYESDEQFAPLASKLAIRAGDEVIRYRDLFVSVDATATVLSRGERAWIDAGIGLGLAGEKAAATKMFDLHIERYDSDEGKEWRTDVDDARSQRARFLKQIVADTPTFRAQIRDDVQQARTLLRLEGVSDLPF